MSWIDIVPLCLAEIVGDTGYKWFANSGGAVNFGIGTAGYVAVVYFLIRSLQGSTLIVVNTAWDGLSTIIEDSYAFIVLGERYEHWIQYVGLVFVIIGLFFLKIPVKSAKAFEMPSFDKMFPSSKSKQPVSK
jgi:multidrug transporter EmrE-like cation transporter